MAEEGDVLTDLNSAPNGADNEPAAGLITQYVKDLSVENPNAPDSFQWQDQAQLDVQFNIGAERVNEEIHEVELKIAVSSKSDRGTAFLVELSYCGLVGMRNLPEEQAHAFLYAEAPRILFPFARRVIADVVRDAGYPPLMLEPIDFNGLYIQQLQQRAAEQQAAGGAPAPGGEA
ncbi:protein-export chaperone SecB [Croceicoccus estronivorus]|uniref:protein-export chaperone SecB n=1 Tax=Croceicoccus estronivorus TaxID=1172626 RepID=UPI00082DA309|nr:protein-export chaperone SecB [Croceicoccus estronivorus]OCC25444.1 protein-export chaperone SecB [Croceicoccus estronivorus]